jgi:MFS family permease
VTNTKEIAGSNRGSNSLEVSVNVLTTFLVSVSMGMLAVLVPVHLSELEFNDATIGAALSFETLASLLICLLIPNILRLVGLRIGFLLSMLLRVPSALLLPFLTDLSAMMLVIFVHGMGCYTLLVLMQTWVNTIQFKGNKGLMVALYSTAISVGFAVGPIVVNMVGNNPEEWASIKALFDFVSTNTGLVLSSDKSVAFGIAAVLSAFGMLPVLVFWAFIPNVSFGGTAKIWKAITQSKGAMFSMAMAGVSNFSVAAFITIYGLKNGLSFADASLLLTAFMLGSLLLEVPIAALSDYFDRRYFIVGCTLACLVCAVYLPIAIYTPVNAWVLVFVWGGTIAAIYSVALAIVGERYTDLDEQIAANAGYSLMESIGGTVGILAIGLSMTLIGTDGMPYIIMFASLVYFSFALTRYPVE